MKSIIKSALARFGYTLAKSNGDLKSQGLSSPDRMTEILTRVSRLGFDPATVIDVGVASGTPALHHSFPNAFHLLIEPLVEFEAEIESLLRSRRGKAVLAAATSENGEIQINVHTGHLDGSSILCEQMGQNFDGVVRTVPSVMIDTIVEENELQGPFLMKADVQGAEIEVLEGAKRVLADTELLLLEVSLFEFMKESPQLFDVVSYVKDLDFAVYDIYGGHDRPLDGALGQCDIAFVKEQGRFRSDHRYATPEQWRKITGASGHAES